MSNRTKNQIFYYILLIAILTGGFYSVLILKNNRDLQVVSIIIMAIAYVAWGIVHHVLEKTFHLKIVVEYMLLALIVATLLIILLSLA